MAEQKQKELICTRPLSQGLQSIYETIALMTSTLYPNTPHRHSGDYSHPMRSGGDSNHGQPLLERKATESYLLLIQIDGQPVQQDIVPSAEVKYAAQFDKYNS
jgi:hypothetical protein